MESEDKENNKQKTNKESKITVQDWLHYFESQKKILAEGNNLNLILFYIIGIFFVVCLMALIFYKTYYIFSIFGLVISIILLGFNCYTRFNTENVMLELDRIMLNILMDELSSSTEILKEMNKVFKKK